MGTERVLNNLKLGKLLISSMTWPRLPNLGVWQPAPCATLAVPSIGAKTTFSCLDDPDFAFFEDES